MNQPESQSARQPDPAVTPAGRGGRCLCGAVRYRFEGAPNWQAHCHCESCRRATSAPFTSYFGVSHGRWRWSGATPAVFASSPGVRRHFCARCGSPMAYESTRWPDEIHFFAASLDDPSDYQPQLHVHWNERLPWVVLADGLPVRRSPRRMAPEEDGDAVLSLIRAAFAGMEGRIDPPSSVGQLDRAALARQAAEGEVWLVEDPGVLLASVFLIPKPGRLYIGKLAVAAAALRQGLGRQLLEHAAARAQALGLPVLELQSRVELTENHAFFRACGFVQTAATAHPGYDRATSLTFTRAVG